jgi:hypothetical protein
VALPTAPRSGKLDVMTLSEWSAAHPEVALRARERWSNCTVEEWADGANGSHFACYYSSESQADVITELAAKFAKALKLVRVVW